MSINIKFGIFWLLLEYRIAFSKIRCCRLKAMSTKKAMQARISKKRPKVFKKSVSMIFIFAILNEIVAITPMLNMIAAM